MSEVQASAGTLYEQLGGESGVWLLVDRFYNVMDSDPRVAPLRGIHPPDLESSRQKLFMFLSGWTGGPDLFVQAFGHPRLRMRHMPFAVDESMRDQWMLCMGEALDGLELEDTLRQRLYQALWDLADFMRNR
ncbi:group II truncated hemoglobin [Laribacter hongkongensis]|uniref:group II truncated hemoglobin n=1 Tax=Laribacter hongkongensis TaxID=168471 RepID=UPI001EFE7A0E|nr:group II truncated hemoglobin [Laribacter hongkongensis]MCG9059336.1 group II truncated hemoglobin [Laribacter hongkongensis]MCG9086387.1 group II truncated hemoglobin [Laribacter hongkongensis]